MCPCSCRRWPDLLRRRRCLHPAQEEAGAITWSRFTQTFRFGCASLAWIASCPSCGTKSPTASLKRRAMAAGFYGKPYQPGGIIKNDIEYILFLRKGGEYRSAPMIQKALSMLTREEMQAWQRSIWTDLRGASTRAGHPAPYPDRTGRTAHQTVLVSRAIRCLIRSRARAQRLKLLSSREGIRSLTKSSLPMLS